MDPVSVHYWNSIRHLTFYVESQLEQLNRTLDQDWSTFQDACKTKAK